MMPRMGMGGPPKVENPLHLSFRNPNWPANLITADNVLEYFCNPANTFYDMASCNQQIKMQNIMRPVEECLRTMPGIQFIVWHAQPPIFVICKQRRNSVQNVTPLAYYYVNNGNVHQAPDMYSLVQSKLLGALEPIRAAFQEATKYAKYNTAKGYYWEFKNNAREKRKTDDKKDPEAKLADRSTNFQLTRTQMLLNQLMEEMPPHEALEKEVPDEKKEFEVPTTSSKKEPVFAEPTRPAKKD